MQNSILHLFPKTEFYQAVKRTNAERHAQGFTCWEQFVAMLFCQLGRAHSLREIAGGLRSCEGKLKHLGISAPSHSTLAYANEHRPWQLYQLLFLQLLDHDGYLPTFAVITEGARPPISPSLASCTLSPIPLSWMIEAIMTIRCL